MIRLSLDDEEWLGWCSTDAESLIEARLREAGFDLTRPIARSVADGRLLFTQSIEH